MTYNEFLFVYIPWSLYLIDLHAVSYVQTTV